MAAIKGKRRYSDDDEIDQSIRDFNSSKDRPDEPKEQANQPEPNQPEPNQPEPNQPEEGFGITRQAGVTKEGEAVATEDSVFESGELASSLENVHIPECSCCGAKWTVAGNRIKNGCGCRIHPVCKHCDKCKGHCTCRG
jgi:hypothetical protein